MTTDVLSIESRVDQHTLLKEDMNHKTKVNTSPAIQQAENAIVPTLSVDAIRNELLSIDDHALTAQTLCEIAFEILDAVIIADQSTMQSMTRLTALVRSAYSNAITIQESVIVISLALEEIEGVAA